MGKKSDPGNFSLQRIRFIRKSYREKMDLPSLSLSILNQNPEKRIPFSGNVEITSACNLSCCHCYIRESENRKPGELSPDQWNDIFAQLAAAGCLWLLVTGGEPLMRDDFREIYLNAKRNGLVVTLFTNGTLINREIISFLKHYPPLNIEITLYGATAETYEKVTGVQGSFSHCMRGIRLIKNSGLPLRLKTMLIRQNVGELNLMKKLAEKIGAPFRFDPVITRNFAGDKDQEKNRLTPAEIFNIEIRDQKRIREWLKFHNKYKGPPPQPDLLFQCGAGINEFSIDSRGNLNPCVLYREFPYNLLTGSLAEGWNRHIPNILARKWAGNPTCKNCDLFAVCGQCPGFAFLETGRSGEPVQYLCEIARCRENILNGRFIKYRKEEKHETNGKAFSEFQKSI